MMSAMRRFGLAVAVLGLVAGTAELAEAGVVTKFVEGHISSIFDPSGTSPGGVALGMGFTMQVVYDDSVPMSSGYPGAGFYDDAIISLSINLENGESFTDSGAYSTTVNRTAVVSTRTPYGADQENINEEFSMAKGSYQTEDLGGGGTFLASSDIGFVFRNAAIIPVRAIAP